MLTANYPGTGAYPGNSGLLPVRTTAYDGGSCTAPVNNCATWSGTLAGPLTDSAVEVGVADHVHGRGPQSDRSPAAPVRRTATAIVPVVIPPTSPASANAR